MTYIQYGLTINVQKNIITGTYRHIMSSRQYRLTRTYIIIETFRLTKTNRQYGLTITYKST